MDIPEVTHNDEVVEEEESRDVVSEHFDALANADANADADVDADADVTMKADGEVPQSW